MGSITKTVDKELARLIRARGEYIRSLKNRREADTREYDEQIAVLMAKVKFERNY